ncbi:MAG: extracellular solute-binding protein [bacterium]
MTTTPRAPSLSLGRWQRTLFSVGVVFALTLVGFGCRGGQQVVESLPQIQLEYWTVFDSPDVYASVIQNYRTQHPNVHIEVKKFTYEEYRTRLLEAWARGEGPDLFSLPNAAIGKYRDLITPMPSTMKLPTLVVSGGCSKDVRVVEKPKETIRPELLDQTFLPVVADDVLFDNAIYGLPLASDTLALYYNKDLLNAAKIIAPPQTWQELTDMVDATKGGLTKEEQGTILQSGIALGTAKNIARSVDLLSLLMMQSGTQMVDTSGTAVAFDRSSPNDKEFIPGASALTFYTSFANPARVTYSWNDSQPDAAESFAAGKTAFFIGYSYQADILRRANPLLNFGIAPVPQISTAGPQIDYANYWIETVAARTEHPDEAWDFLLYETDAQQVKSYLEATKKPTALKGLLTSQRDDLDLQPFVDQLMIAKSWYHGYDDAAMETIMQQLITSVNSGTEVNAALSLAARQVQETYNKP